MLPSGALLPPSVGLLLAWDGKCLRNESEERSPLARGHLPLVFGPLPHDLVVAQEGSTVANSRHTRPFHYILDFKERPYLFNHQAEFAKTT